ncbi:MAG: carboxypeptidase M32 [Thermoleophilia bacterium]
MTGRSSSDLELVRDWMGTLADLGGAAGMLGWDRETLMPPAGAEGRAFLMGTLAALHHRELVREDAGDALAALADDDGLSADDAAAVRLATRARDRAVRVPESLVREISEASSRSLTAWGAAREADDYGVFAGPLATLVGLKRQEAEAIGVGDEPYDALLDEFEPGARAADLEPVFAGLREALTPLVAEAAARPARTLPEREWPFEGQIALAREVAELLGFDMAGGVITTSVHPFTGSPHRGDVRFTTRFEIGTPVSGLSAVMHELGHALYEQGFPGEAVRTPVHDAPSLGAHESQSRFWENQVGRSPAFWERIEPIMRRLFPDAMKGIDPALLHDSAQVVRPSLIRVEADEVTYNLHIALRFGLELALMRGDLTVGDLPGAFADGMEEMLGVRPPTTTLGAMQDIHWADGLFGYFPTYTLGNLYAAQLAEAAEEALGGIDRAVANGDFAAILGFMRDRVHRHGARRPTRELMREATGRELGPDALIAHLERSYLHR